MFGAHRGIQPPAPSETETDVWAQVRCLPQRRKLPCGSAHLSLVPIEHAVLAALQGQRVVGQVPNQVSRKVPITRKDDSLEREQRRSVRWRSGTFPV